MASNKVLITKSHLTNIGNAIREKTNTSGTILLTEMPDKIRSIKTGGTTTKPVIRSLSITSNGTYNAPTGVDGYSPITVNVEQTLTDLITLELEPGESLFSAFRSGYGDSNNYYLTIQQSLLDKLIDNSRENIIFKPTLTTAMPFFLSGSNTNYNFNDNQIIKLNYIGQDGIDLGNVFNSTPNIKLPKIKIRDNYIRHTSHIFSESKKEYIEDVFLDNDIRLANNIGKEVSLSHSYDGYYNNSYPGYQFYNCKDLIDIDTNLLYKLFNKNVCVDDLESNIYRCSFANCFKLRNVNNLGIYNAKTIYFNPFENNYCLNTFTFTNNASAIWSGSQISLAGVNTNITAGLNADIFESNIETSIWSDYTITTDFEEFMSKVSSEDIIYKSQDIFNNRYYLAGKYRYDIEAIKDTLYSLPDCSEGSEVNTITLYQGCDTSKCIELQEAIAAAVSKNWTVAWNTNYSYGNDQIADYYANHGYHFE